MRKICDRLVRPLFSLGDHKSIKMLCMQWCVRFCLVVLRFSMWMIQSNSARQLFAVGWLRTNSNASFVGFKKDHGVFASSPFSPRLFSHHEYIDRIEFPFQFWTKSQTAGNRLVCFGVLWYSCSCHLLMGILSYPKVPFSTFGLSI